MFQGEKRNTLWISVFAMFFIVTACASQPKVVSGLEQVQKNRRQLDETREKLKRTAEELKGVQERLANMQEAFAKTDDVATREKAKTSLDRLALKVQEVELDFSDLLAQNRLVANDLDARLRGVAESNSTLMSGAELPAAAPVNPAPGVPDATTGERRADAAPAPSDKKVQTP